MITGTKIRRSGKTLRKNKPENPFFGKYVHLPLKVTGNRVFYWINPKGAVS